MAFEEPRGGISDGLGYAGGSLTRRGFLGLTGAVAGSAVIGGFSGSEANAGAVDGEFPISELAATHDLPSLPRWGPYSKAYFGISHIPDLGRGLVFNLTIAPALSYGPVILPEVMDRSKVHPWEASPRLEFYSLRQQIIEKDQLYCDLSFSRVDSGRRQIRLEIFNETSTAQELVLNSLAQLCFPPLRQSTAQPIRLSEVELPAGGIWVHALDYADLRFAKPRPTDNLVPDGKWRAEERRHESVGGSVVARDFGRDADDRVLYRLQADRTFGQAILVWRFQSRPGSLLSFRFLLDGAPRDNIHLHGNGEFITVAVPIGPLAAGRHELRFISLGGDPVALNGFAILDAQQADQLRFPVRQWHPAPVVTAPSLSSVLLKYADVPNYYGFSISERSAQPREIRWRDIHTALGNDEGWRTRSRIWGGGPGLGDPDALFLHFRSNPFFVQPHSKLQIHGLVCAGSKAEVQNWVSGFDPKSEENERIYQSAKAAAFQSSSTPAGKTFQFSQRIAAAVAMTNLVYPLRTQGQYIRHYSPGRKWDSLYTWDSGFTGLGLLEIDRRCAMEILNAYTTPPGAQSAFIHHGTPLPVQIYLFLELWNRTRSNRLLAYFYPRLRQFHLFLAGRLGSSTTRRQRNRLISTWDYFYNSGGWDDYPPQVFVHQHKLTSSVVPVINSAHAIRCAKLLRQVAVALGKMEDIAEYNRDIEDLSTSLQRYSWDPASGYYGYVAHTEDGEPSGILRTETGENFNMGLDGVSPLIAGICSPEQEQRLLEHLFSSRNLWTSIGITTVDQSAPYYNPDGYWNGSVWFAHQWFLWKTMLDLGRIDLADRIAQAGLAVWKSVTDASYGSMEHFKPHAPYGFGWYQLSSLSSPALSWFAATYTPGRLTCGFDTWVEAARFSSSNRRLRATLISPVGAASRRTGILACMRPASRYRVLWNGAPIEHSVAHDSLLEIHLPRPSSGELSIEGI